MAKGVSGQALNNYGTASGIGKSLYGAASGISSGLVPALQTEAYNPQGISPTTMAQMNTATQQSAGGSQAGAVGQGALLASRTKNAGTADAAISQSARTAGQTAANGALKTQLANAQMKNQQQQAGLSGLEGLYGADLSGSLSGLSAANSALNVANQADANNPWNLVLKSGLQAATAAI